MTIFSNSTISNRPFVVVIATLLILSLASAQAPPSGCEDPLTAILDILQCVKDSDATCAALGYNTVEFKKLHNGIDTNTVIDGADYWEGAFSLISIDFSYDHTVNIGPNMASIRYIEKVTFTDGTAFGLPPSSEYPWSAKMDQHEHALVTVDDDCKMVLWDQYGDNAEQTAVDDASAAMVGDLCSKGIFPPEFCSPPPPSPPVETTTKAPTSKKSKKAGKKGTKGKKAKKHGWIMPNPKRARM